MDAIEKHVQDAKPRHRQLLNTLTETSYASSALEQQDRYVEDLRQQIQHKKRQIADLEKKRASELADHEKYQRSIMKRYAYKMSGQSDKFVARAAKEEKEYFDALHEEHIAKKMCESTEHAYEAARASQQSLKDVVEENKRTQKELTDLYESIFQGPTPGFPEEDHAETMMGETQQRYNQLRNQTEARQHVVKLLLAAQTRMRAAGDGLARAHTASRVDMFTSGPMADMMERSALSRAQADASAAYQLLSQARSIAPQEVRQLPMMEIAHGHLISDVLFDNVFTDMMFNQRIKQSIMEHQQVLGLLDREVANAQGRLAECSGQMPGAEAAMREWREKLQDAREKAFYMLAEGKT